MSSCLEKYVEEKPVSVEKEEASLPATRKKACSFKKIYARKLRRLPRNKGLYLQR